MFIKKNISVIPTQGIKLSLCLFLAVGLLALAGCDLSRNQLHTDREADLEFQDYRDALASRLPEDTDVASHDSSIPDLQSYIVPPSENLKAMPLVSVSVNQTVPLRDVIFELAEQAVYDVELDPRIRGSIIFTARNRPFDVVIDRISDIAGLRYSFEDDILRVELDEPYNKTYKLDYLAYSRSSSSTISNNVSVVQGEGTDTGSTFEATSESLIDFWAELEGSLTQILGVNESVGNLRTGSDPHITAAASSAAPVDPVVVHNADGSVTVQPPQATLQVNSLPTSSDSAGGAEDAELTTASFSLNKQAGMVSVYASERQQKEVTSYLTMLEKSVTSQVLIEAKIFEVSLTDEFSAGINWNALNLFSGGETSIGYGNAGVLTTLTDVASSTINTALNPLPNPNSEFLALFNGNDLQAAIQAVSRFGTVKALASPRLTVLNNQSAVLNVADNQVYFQLDVDVTTDDSGGTQVTVDSEIRNVPEGVLINVQPSINIEEQKIMMAVRPTVTRIVAQVADPGVSFVIAQTIASADPNTDLTALDDIESNIPVVNVQEMDSVINMNSGQAIVMGGLIEDRTQTVDTGVPVLSEIPLLGNAFKTHTDQIQKTELVVFLKATIVEGNNTIHDTDKDLYRKFSSDRRPLRF